MSVLVAARGARTDTSTWTHVHNLRTIVAQSRYFSTMAKLSFEMGNLTDERVLSFGYCRCRIRGGVYAEQTEIDVRVSTSRR